MNFYHSGFRKFFNHIAIFVVLALSLPLSHLLFFSDAQGYVNPIPCDTSIIDPNFMTACDLAPDTVLTGQNVYVSGYNLATTVFIASTTTYVSTTLIGSTNSAKTLITFVIPFNFPVGTYTVSIQGDVTQQDGSLVFQQAALNKILTVTNTPPSNPDPYDDGTGSGTTTNYPPPPPFKQIVSKLIPPPASSFQDLISNAFTYAIDIVGIAVFIMITYGGFLWLTGAANPGNISKAKSIIFNAIIGAVLLISSYVILYTVNPSFVGGKFNLTGLKAPSNQAQGTTRLFAVDELGAASAVTEGCNIALELRDITAVECPSLLTDTVNLPLDPVIQITDANTNQQTGATSIQNSGNLGAGRRIVVLDTGYNKNHPELSSSYLGGWDFVNRDNDPDDDHTGGVGSPGHGSHVAGIITGDGNNPQAKGVAPQAEIIAGKILDSQGKGYWSSMIEGIYWAINGPDKNFGTADDFKPDVINISMGGGVYTGICDNNDDTTKLLLKALDYARSHGALPVVAAGNTSTGVSLPGCLSNAFTVGAINSSSGIANFSGQGQGVDVVAPGIDIYSSLLGNNYGPKSGTSMATPVVSGLIALIKNAHPNYSVSDLERAVTSTAIDLGPTGRDNTYGWGGVTSSAAGSGSQPIPPPQPIPPSPPSQPTPPNPDTSCSGSSCGRIWAYRPSCTKGSIASNPNCDITVGFQGTSVSVPDILNIRLNGSQVTTLNCQSLPCSGNYTSPNPRAGSYQFTLHTSSGTQIARTTVFIYTSGTISTASSCAKTSNPGNPNCDVTLSIDAPTVFPSQLLIKKDGNNWRLVPCGSSACNVTVIDPNPSLGIHTYTLHDSSDNSRLSRTTIFISQGTAPAPPPPPCSTPLCISGRVFTDTNANGIFDQGEAVWAGETIGLETGPLPVTTFVRSTITDPAGFYFFGGLAAGTNWRVNHTIPTGYIRTTDDSRPYIPLTANITHDFGFVDPTTLSGNRILEICGPNEQPSLNYSCDPGITVKVGQTIQLSAWYNFSGDRMSWSNFTDFSMWQGCNNNGPCFDNWFLNQGLFNGVAIGGPYPITANFGGTVDSADVIVTP